MESPTNREIMINLKNLSENVKNGFKGVHDRQDKTNGTVADNKEFRIQGKTYFKLIGIALIALIIPMVLTVFNSFFQ